MIAASNETEQEVRASLYAEWERKAGLLQQPLHADCQCAGAEEDELLFSLGDTPDHITRTLRIAPADGGRFLSCRGPCEQGACDWKELPDRPSASAEMDAFIADFEGSRWGGRSPE